MTNALHANWAGTGPRAIENGVGARNANPARTLENQQHNFASDDGDSKASVTMPARAAMVGCTLHELSDEGRWQHSTVAPCLRAVGDLLRRIGGRP